MEAGKVELAIADAHLPALLRSVGNMIRIRVEAKGLVFRLDAGQALPRTIRADERRLRQVLLNLLGNAVNREA